MRRRDVATQREDVQIEDVTTLRRVSPDERSRFLAGVPERSDAKIVRRIDLGAVTNEKIGALEVVPVACPVKRGAAIAVERIDVCTRLHKNA